MAMSASVDVFIIAEDPYVGVDALQVRPIRSIRREIKCAKPQRQCKQYQECGILQLSSQGVTDVATCRTLLCCL
eukprot:1339743-Rhodomonas_salina.3